MARNPSVALVVFYFLLPPRSQIMKRAKMIPTMRLFKSGTPTVIASLTKRRQ
jgi:hypothetical protein